MALITQKPLRQIPKYICYRSPKSDVYRLVDKDGKSAGQMVAQKMFLEEGNPFYPDVKDSYSLYIKRLYVEKEYRHKGAGQAFLKIAAKDSYERNCNGNVHLIAAPIERGNYPHKFYRTNGFDSQDKHKIELIDTAIKENTELPPARWCIPMFLTKH